MNEALVLAGLLGALSIGVISPGPSFVMVARVAVASTRADAVCVALGMGVGALAYAVAALLGLQAVLQAMPALYLGLKIAGGIYLAYLGWMIFRHASRPLDVDAANVEEGDAGHAARASGKRSFLLGLGTHLGNPKTAVVYASVFAAFVPATFSMGFAVALLALVFVVEAGWYALVGTVLSARAPQRAYLAWKRWIDRTAGTVMGVLGAKLVVDAVRSP